jgi:hypothetical protein
MGQKQTSATSTNLVVRAWRFPADSFTRSTRIWLEGAEKFIIAPLYPIVTIAGNCMEALDVQNGDATPADLNKTGMLEGALDQIDGGSLDAKHLSEKFLRQPDVIAS